MQEQMMTPNKRGAIFALAHKAGLESDALHDVVLKITGRESIKQLTHAEANRVISELRRLSNDEGPLGWLTGPQKGKIFALCRELNWVTPRGAVDMKRLEGFVKARFKVATLRWVQTDTAGKVIEALKAMAEGGRGERKMKEAANHG